VSVGLVVVSHSAKVAEGVVEMAAQMAAGVRIEAAGGTDEGGIGTDATLIAAIQASTGSSLDEVAEAARGAATMGKSKQR